MKTKVIVILTAAIFFTSCEDAYKKIQDNLGQYNTGTDNVNSLYQAMQNAGEDMGAVKTTAKNLIDYADTYLTYYEKEVPKSIDGVNNIENAMLYYLSVSRQFALIATDYAGKAATLTPDEAEEQFFSKLDPLVEAETDAIMRWEELMEKFAKDHGIQLIELSK